MQTLRYKETRGTLPTTVYSFMVNGKEVGFLELNHQPTAGKDIPETMASHIYYEVFPEERNKGYGSTLLSLGLLEAKKLGFREVLLTCEDTNHPSRKAIEKNGGEFLESAPIPFGSGVLLKYRIGIFD